MNGHWGKIAVMSGAGGAFIIYEMATATEYPSPAEVVPQYVQLTMALIGVVGSAVGYLSQK